MNEYSYVHGISKQPLIYTTIGRLLDTTASTCPDRSAIIVRQQNARLSYAALNELVNRVAANLLQQGIAPGDRVGIWSPNNLQWVVSQFATARIGAILVNINPAYRISELEYVLNKVSCKALILAEQFKSSDYVGMLTSLAPELKDCNKGRLRANKLPSLTTVICLGAEARPGMYRFAEFEQAPLETSLRQLTAIADQLQPDDPINIQFTSGTTGFPKGATLTHFNIVNNGYFVAEAMRLTGNDRLCIPVPLYHCFGMVMGVLGCVSHGATMVFPDEAFDPGSVLATIAAERCTALYGVPTMFIAELAHPDFTSYDLSSLRTGIMAGAPCPAETMARVMSEMHMSEVTIAYGMTETSPVSFQTSVDDPFEQRIKSVGRVHPHVQVKIIDVDGHTVPRGIRGELCTRGYSVMQGYWDDEEKTREAIDRAGWMHTGDLAIIDELGYCDIVGRVKDMIIRGGENIYPREIEEFLRRHPDIRDVAVFGIPDPRYGEQVIAWVQVKAGKTLDESMVKSFCAGQIAHYKIPHRVEFVEEFPLTATGKIQKFIMREQMIARLAGNDS
jgi:fatty-acyl-CoA synthase